MAKLWAFVLPLLLSVFVLELVASDAGVDPDPHSAETPHESKQVKCEDDSTTIALVKELDRVKSQLSTLEQSLLERDVDLQDKDKSIFSIQAELERLKNEKGGELETTIKSTHTKLEELEVKVVELEDALKKKELELHAFKDRVKTLEAVEVEQSSRFKQLEKMVAEQKRHIEKAEQALQVAEETLRRAQVEAEAKEVELLKVHGGWLPPWTSSKVVELRASTAAQWAKYGEPLINTALEKASEKVATVQEWTKPHVETIRMYVEQKWNPVLKQSLEKVTATVAPHVETAKSKVVDGYEASRAFLLPQLTKVQEVLEPYVQAAKETSRPYVETVAVLVRPHFERVQVITRPYTEKASQSYRDFLTSATSYHHQLQGSVREKMKKIDFLAALASKELVWFLASALLLLPVMGILLFFSSAFGAKKPAKAARSHGTHGHKKTKRAKQVDK